MMNEEMGLRAKEKVADNSPDETARVHIQQIKEDLQERIAHHRAQFEKLSHLAEQHQYAAQQYSILATAGDPVPGPDNSDAERYA